MTEKHPLEAMLDTQIAEAEKSAEDVKSVETPAVKEEVSTTTVEAQGEPSDTTAEEDKPKTNSAYARLRIEKEEAQRQLEEARRQLAEKEGYQKGLDAAKPKDAVVEEDEPDPLLDPKGYTKWLKEQLTETTGAELKEVKDKLAQYEQKESLGGAISAWEKVDTETQSSNAVYKQAIEYQRESATKALKAAHPDATDAQIKQEVKNMELRFVGKMSAAGVNPVTAIISDAIQLGFNPVVTPAKKEEPASIAKNIASISADKKKSTGLSASGSASSGELSSTDFVKANLAQLLAYSDDEVRRIK